MKRALRLGAVGPFLVCAGLALEAAPAEVPVKPQVESVERGWGREIDGLRCRISAEKPAFARAEPIKVVFELRNMSDRKIAIMKSADMDFSVRVRLWDGEGKLVPPNLWAHVDADELSAIEYLDRGKSVKKTLSSAPERGFGFRYILYEDERGAEGANGVGFQMPLSPGSYLLQAVYTVQAGVQAKLAFVEGRGGARAKMPGAGGLWTGVLESNVVEIDIENEPAGGR